MKTRLLKVKTTGSREQGNLRPIIADYLPGGVNLSVVEYGEGYAVVKVAWSEHPLVSVKPDAADLEKFLALSSIIETLTDHPKAKQLKTTHSILADAVEEKLGKRIAKGKLEGSFIRKEKVRGEDVYVLDEG